jgi:hypothetical protein
MAHFYFSRSISVVAVVSTAVLGLPLHSEPAFAYTRCETIYREPEHGRCVQNEERAHQGRQEEIRAIQGEISGALQPSLDRAQQDQAKNRSDRSQTEGAIHQSVAERAQIEGSIENLRTRRGEAWKSASNSWKEAFYHSPGLSPSVAWLLSFCRTRPETLQGAQSDYRLATEAWLAIESERQAFSPNGLSPLELASRLSDTSLPTPCAAFIPAALSALASTRGPGDPIVAELTGSVQRVTAQNETFRQLTQAGSSVRTSLATMSQQDQQLRSQISEKLNQEGQRRSVIEGLDQEFEGRRQLIGNLEATIEGKRRRLAVLNHALTQFPAYLAACEQIVERVCENNPR